MTRVLVTGMSGTGKSTVLLELQRRGHVVVDTDYDGWTQQNGTWDEPRMAQLLADHRDVIVSGTVDNQGRLFYDRFDHVVLLSAPLEVRRNTGSAPACQQTSRSPRPTGCLLGPDTTFSCPLADS